MRRHLTAATALAALAVGALAAAPRAGAQDERDRDRNRDRDPNAFRWEGKIPRGRWLRVKNLNGGIRVVAGDDDVTQVRGEKSWRRGDPRDVRFEVVRDGDNVTICALWFDNSSCDAEGYHSHGDRGRGRNNDVSVEFTVALARGVKVDASAVNGSVDVRGARAEVVARSVNGRVDAETSTGPVEATTVNGSVHVRMAALDDGDSDMDFGSVNGSVTVEVPEDFDADLEMSTVNGSLRSDFPLTVSGRFNSRHLRAQLGRGGRRVKMHSVNGSIELRKIE